MCPAGVLKHHPGKYVNMILGRLHLKKEPFSVFRYLRYMKITRRPFLEIYLYDRAVTVFVSRYVKGVPLFNKRYMKEVSFLPKWYIKA